MKAEQNVILYRLCRADMISEVVCKIMSWILDGRAERGQQLSLVCAHWGQPGALEPA